MVDVDAPARRRGGRAFGNGHAPLLMARERFDEQSVVKRHVDDDPEYGGAVEIDLLLGHLFEEAAAEPVTAHRRDLHRLGARGNGKDGRCHNNPERDRDGAMNRRQLGIPGSSHPI